MIQAILGTKRDPISKIAKEKRARDLAFSATAPA
jgi:hypothetical protein